MVNVGSAPDPVGFNRETESKLDVEIGTTQMYMVNNLNPRQVLTVYATD